MNRASTSPPRPASRFPPGYHRHFKSFDGAVRQLVVEGAGGPSWFTEYNVLTGLSARSYGRFATSVTRIAGGRVTRGLPHALSRCGYKTFSLYPFYGAFLGSRGFQTTAGIQRYMDMTALGTRNFEPDSFYFDQATKIIARERGNGPLFLFVYTVANHFPWDTRLRPELTPNWRDLGNAPNIDEYIRRQGMTAHDYAALLDRLKRDFPTESFLIVRFGDHQPEFGYRIVDPTLDEAAIARHLQAFDPRYFTSYYAIDTVNFSPAIFRPRSIRSMHRTFRWSSRKPPACRSIPRSPNRRRSCNAAMACSIVALVARRRADSTGC